jgi:hypothetical protein
MNGTASARWRSRIHSSFHHFAQGSSIRCDAPGDSRDSLLCNQGNSDIVFVSRCILLLMDKNPSRPVIVHIVRVPVRIRVAGWGASMI